LLNRCGTVGNFAEDGMELVHEVINALSRQHASLDPKRQAIQIVRQTAGRKRTNALGESGTMEQKGEQKTKRQRAQGERKAAG
jgi:hypothetical protein